MQIWRSGSATSRCCDATMTRARAAAVSALREAFTDRDVRVERAARAQELLDGRGRARVAEALVSLAR